MATWNDDDGSTTVQEVPERRTFVSKENMQTAALFNNDTPLVSIQNIIGGKKWIVDYFIQIRDINTNTNPPDINLPASVQQYNRIDKTVLYVQNAIEQTGDPGTMIGTAYINIGTVVSQDDVFKAVMLGGRDVILRITSVDKQNYNLHDVYLISFVVFNYIDTDPSIYNNIVLKVNKTYVFNDNFLYDHGAPIILKDEYLKKINLADTIPILCNHYFNKFTNNKYKILGYEKDGNIHHDQYLYEFIRTIISTDDYSGLPNLTTYDFGRVDNIYNLWDGLLRKSATVIKSTNIHLGFTNSNITVALAPPVLRELAQFDGLYIIGDVADATYIFSEAWYTMVSSVDMSLFEQSVMTFVNDGYINIDDMNTLIDTVKTRTDEDQYYFIPILILLIKNAISKTFSVL